MVNLSKRLSVLNPLYNIRTSRGAVRLPTLPQPELFRLELRYPKNRKIKPDATGVTTGAHGFSKAVLPALKYYNPALDIHVETFPRSPTLLTLHFQCQDPDKLRNLAQPGNRVTPVDDSASPSYLDSDAPRPSAANDEVTLKEVPANSSLPQPLYQRSVTIALRGKKTWQILKWFKRRTGYEKVPKSYEDQRYGMELKQRSAQVEEERARSKVIQDAIDREKRMLEQAKKIAEANATETAV